MTGWRVALGAVLILVAGAPLLWPVIAPFLEGASANVWSDPGRLAILVANTFLLALGTLLVALPLGILLAALLFRTDLPGRRFFLGGGLLLLFVPIPILVSGWQALVGAEGFFPLAWWGAGADRPWSEGLVPAVWVHGLAGVPWVMALVGAGLLSVERELEDEALLAAPFHRVLWRVTLPRCRWIILAAAAWVAVQTAADISVTDMLLVPTFAEEVHAQFTMGGRDGVARAMLLCLPGVLLVLALLLLLMPRLETALFPLQLSFQTPRRFNLGRSRWFWFGVVAAVFMVLVIAPIAALVGKLGLASTPRAWSAAHAWNQLWNEAQLFGGQVAATLATALATGVLCAFTALVACWLARDSRLVQILLWVFVAFAWAIPAPAIGIAIKEVIVRMVTWIPVNPDSPSWLQDGVRFLHQAFYFGPSPLPIVWAHAVRFLPFALVLFWPMVRMVPLELRDAARLEGAGPWTEFWHVYFAQTRRGVGWVALAVTALALGEVGAGARVETPGWETFAKLIFDRMHYGVEGNVAALSLLALIMIGAMFGLGYAALRIGRRLLGK